VQGLRTWLRVNPGVEVFDGYITTVLFIERLLSKPAGRSLRIWPTVKLAETYEIPKARRGVRADRVQDLRHKLLNRGFERSRKQKSCQTAQLGETTVWLADILFWLRAFRRIACQALHEPLGAFFKLGHTIMSKRLSISPKRS
jgi:hypothetical protein